MTDEQQKPTITSLESKILESRIATVKMGLSTIALDSAVGTLLLSFSYHYAEEGHYGAAAIGGCLGAVFGYLGYENGKKVVDMYRKAAGRGIIK